MIWIVQRCGAQACYEFTKLVPSFKQLFNQKNLHRSDRFPRRIQARRNESFMPLNRPPRSANSKSLKVFPRCPQFPKPNATRKSTTQSRERMRRKWFVPRLRNSFALQLTSHRSRFHFLRSRKPAPTSHSLLPMTLSWKRLINTETTARASRQWTTSRSSKPSPRRASRFPRAIVRVDRMKQRFWWRFDLRISCKFVRGGLLLDIEDFETIVVQLGESRRLRDANELSTAQGIEPNSCFYLSVLNFHQANFLRDPSSAVTLDQRTRPPCLASNDCNRPSE